MTNKWHKLVAQNVRNLRMKAGFNQEQFADKCMINRSFLGMIERGERNVSLSTLVTIAEALKITPDQLMTSQPRS
jgi:XRE family transcriptional regulator, regulator of sulfur utilization